VALERVKRDGCYRTTRRDKERMGARLDGGVRYAKRRCLVALPRGDVRDALIVRLKTARVRWPRAAPLQWFPGLPQILARVFFTLSVTDCGQPNALEESTDWS
jgi:hypothetical protein